MHRAFLRGCGVLMFLIIIHKTILQIDFEKLNISARGSRFIGKVKRTRTSSRNRKYFFISDNVECGISILKISINLAYILPP